MWIVILDDPQQHVCVIIEYVFKQRAIWGYRVREHQSEEDLFDWRACKDSQATEALWLIFKPEERIRRRIKDSLQHLSDQDRQGQSSAQSFMLDLHKSGFYLLETETKRL